MVKLTVNLDGCSHKVEIDSRSLNGDGIPVQIDGQQIRVHLPDGGLQAGGFGWVLVDGRLFEVQVDPYLQWIKDGSGLHTIQVHVEQPGSYAPHGTCGLVKAPIPGQVTRVLVQPGQKVEACQPLLILEAMKMENELRSPLTGVVKQVSVTSGQDVARGDLLVEVE
jgi:biotin carboxyl carrier protein